MSSFKTPSKNRILIDTHDYAASTYYHRSHTMMKCRDSATGSNYFSPHLGNFLPSKTPTATASKAKKTQGKKNDTSRVVFPAIWEEQRKNVNKLPELVDSTFRRINQRQQQEGNDVNLFFNTLLADTPMRQKRDHIENLK